MKTAIITLLCASLLIAPALADPAGEKQTIQTVGDFTIKGLLGLGFNHCLLEELNCEYQSSARFDVSTWNSESGVEDGRHITVWANWREGVFGPSAAGGFEMIVCSDRDDNGLCTNADSTDDFVSTYSNDAITTECEMDEKDCGDNTDAQVETCIREDVGGGYDDIVVFIGSWADIGLDDNVGAGISAGTYDVYLDKGAFDDSC